MLPSQVEPTARAMMGATKRFYDHINATATSGGTANVQTLTYAVAPAALVAGDVFCFIVGASLTNTGSTTLNVNALGAKTIKYKNANLVGNELRAGGVVTVVYDGTNFQLLGVSYPPSYASVSVLPADPAGTGSASGIMLGLGSSCVLTPGATGKVRFSISGGVFNNTSNDGAILTLRYGTGTAPVNGAAVTGTIISGVFNTSIAAANNTIGFSFHSIVSGLAIGTACWFDLALAAVGSGSIAQAVSLCCDAYELP